MATRLKTIEYAFTQATSAFAAGARCDFNAITLYAPETSGRVFKNAAIQVFTRDNVSSATSPTSWLMGIKLGAVAFDDVTITDTITNSGEHMSFMFVRDVTTYFVTNWTSGASSTCQVGFSLGASDFTNVSAKLLLTYEYEDAVATTRIKTVKIPIESSGIGALTTSLVEIGTNQVPALDTFLPEASKVYRDIFFEVNCRSATSGSNTTTLGLSLDAEASAEDGSHNNTLNSSTYYYRIWKRTDMATNAAHAFKAKTTNATSFKGDNLSAVLCVTYEYDHSASTSIINSIQMAMSADPGFLGGTTTADNSRAKRVFTIAEPGSITLKQSGIFMTYMEAAAPSPVLKMNNQAYRSITVSTATLECGMFSLMHRFDSAAIGGSALVLDRGENTFLLDVYNSNATNFAGNMTALMYLNYTSEKHSSGDAVHNKTITYCLADTASGQQRRLTSAWNPYFPEANWFLTGMNYQITTNQNIAPSTTISLAAKVASSEADGGGWADIYTSWRRTDNEMMLAQNFAKATHLFSRSSTEPTDVTGRLITTLPRIYEIEAGTNVWASVLASYTYHSMTWILSGQVFGSNFSPSGLTIYQHRADTKEVINKATPDTDGKFTLTWYDNTVSYYVSCVEGNTRAGRSGNGTAS